MMFIREGSLLGVLGEVPKKKLGGGVGGGCMCASARESQGGVWIAVVVRIGRVCRLDCNG